jgi:hypothetical protein
LLWSGRPAAAFSPALTVTKYSVPGRRCAPSFLFSSIVLNAVCPDRTGKCTSKPDAVTSSPIVGLRLFTRTAVASAALASTGPESVIVIASRSVETSACASAGSCARTVSDGISIRSMPCFPAATCTAPRATVTPRAAKSSGSAWRWITAGVVASVAGSLTVARSMTSRTDCAGVSV